MAAAFPGEPLVDVSSTALVKHCWERGVMYLTPASKPGPVVIPIRPATCRRTNYRCATMPCSCALTLPPGIHCGVTHGANPACMHFVKRRCSHSARHRHRQGKTRSCQPQRMGRARPGAGRARDPYCRTRYAADQPSQAGQRVRQHLVGGRIRVGGLPARRTGLGHPRTQFSPRRQTP